MTEPSVTVIMPTRALAERATSLRRAIHSVLQQRDVCAIPLIVVNGSQASPELLRELEAEPRLRVHRLHEANLPAALRAGRELVDSPWFTALDDDDTLLPGALALRVNALASRDDHDAIVTNGYRRRDDVNVLHVPADADVESDPLEALLRMNWLLPGSWLCRSATVHANVFDGMPRYLECTYLAARLASEYRMHWMAEPTVVYQVGSPMAESRTDAYRMGQADALRRIMSLPLPERVRREIAGRIAYACHWSAEHELESGRLLDAWRWHLSSLVAPRGWRYLPFSRHLLWPIGRVRS
jgi:hypothetical protein